MGGYGIRMWVILIAGFVLSYGGLSNVVYSKGGDVNTNNQEDLLSLAREIASEHGYEVDKYNFLIGREGDFTTVELEPKRRDDKPGWVRLGGGGMLFFKIENGKYKFIKIRGGE